ncbi:hypothetical protein APX70_02849 [Pseudomonas syringae pv. maculicola]|uniref:UPF0313 domain-containing protein n=1 Tax=Pseudomonas syringae pv. maculicola TaxID=59511 RepID=A0A3M2Z2F5_PSEYM|nr:hypothetical protein APX70_02849 [Pseudomonas syringae pv. maculicola]
MAGKRPDRASLVYSQRCKEAYKHVPIVLGGIEASLRRIAHYDYWQDKVRNSILIDACADILLYGNAERAIVEVAQRLSYGHKIEDITDVRGTALDPVRGPLLITLRVKVFAQFIQTIVGLGVLGLRRERIGVCTNGDVNVQGVEHLTRRINRSADHFWLAAIEQ